MNWNLPMKNITFFTLCFMIFTFGPKLFAETTEQNVNQDNAVKEPDSESESSQDQENEVDDENYATSDLDIDEDSMANPPMSIDIRFGRTWIDQEPFNAEFIQFTPAWYVLEDIPFKLGPSIRKENFIDLAQGYTSGGLLELGLQGSFFWDFGLFTPYVSVEYTFLSRGNILLEKTAEPYRDTANIKIRSSGYEIAIGGQINVVKNGYIVFETVAIGEKRIKKDGQILRENLLDSKIQPELISASEATKARSYRGVSIGYLIEL